MVAVKASAVFTPNEFPTHTYVQRTKDFEREVRNGLHTPGIVVSVSGPSKSGKSVLVQQVAGKDNLIRVFGPQIRSPDDLWASVLDWMGAPSSSTGQTTSGVVNTTTGGGGASLGAPGILTIGGNSSLSKATSSAETQLATYNRSGISQVARDIAHSEYIVFVDDFHYMERAIQAEVAKHLKAGAELGIKSCVASVPHHSDDVVRANSELRGRVQAVDMDYWHDDELISIGNIGFPLLNMNMSDQFVRKLVVEACGSPQLMQALCLQTCYRFDIYERLDASLVFQPNDNDLRRILESTSTFADYSTTVEALHEGPKLRGQDRNQYNFFDGSTGDVYRAVLLALAADPPLMSITYRELMARVGAVCTGSAPTGRAVSEACDQISKIAERMARANAVVQAVQPIEWDRTTDPENMHIGEPYFLFYLRASPKLAELGDQKPISPKYRQIPTSL